MEPNHVGHSDGCADDALLSMDGRNECDVDDHQHRRDPPGPGAIDGSVPAGDGVAAGTDVAAVPVHLRPRPRALHSVQGPDVRLRCRILYLSVHHAGTLRTGEVSAELCKYEAVAIVVGVVVTGEASGC